MRFAVGFVGAEHGAAGDLATVAFRAGRIGEGAVQLQHRLVALLVVDDVDVADVVVSCDRHDAGIGFRPPVESPRCFRCSGPAHHLAAEAT